MRYNNNIPTNTTTISTTSSSHCKVLNHSHDDSMISTTTMSSAPGQFGVQFANYINPTTVNDYLICTPSDQNHSLLSSYSNNLIADIPSWTAANIIDQNLNSNGQHNLQDIGNKHNHPNVSHCPHNYGGDIVDGNDSVEDDILPPGFRFHPTDEELVSFYLASKIRNPNFSDRAVTEADLNKLEPWELPGKTLLDDELLMPI